MAFMGTCEMNVPLEDFIIAVTEVWKRDRKSAISSEWKIKLRIKVHRTTNIVLRVRGKISRYK